MLALQLSIKIVICYYPYKCSGLFPGLYIANAITTPVTAPPRCAIQSTPSCMLPKTISINNKISRGADTCPSCFLLLNIITSRTPNMPKIAPEAPALMEYSPVIISIPDEIMPPAMPHIKYVIRYFTLQKFSSI